MTFACFDGCPEQNPDPWAGVSFGSVKRVQYVQETGCSVHNRGHYAKDYQRLLSPGIYYAFLLEHLYFSNFSIRPNSVCFPRSALTTMNLFFSFFLFLFLYTRSTTRPCPYIVQDAIQGPGFHALRLYRACFRKESEERGFVRLFLTYSWTCQISIDFSRTFFYLSRLRLLYSEALALVVFSETKRDILRFGSPK